MSWLSMVGFRGNQIRTVSEKGLPPLRWLILTDSRINELPAQIRRLCAQLQKLMLSGNQLKTLPPSCRCSRLELLRVPANQLSELPGGS